MSITQRKQLILQPLACRSLEIGRWLWAMEDTRQRTREALEGIGANPLKVLDWVSPVCGNSIGTILYHLAAVEADWLYVEALQQDFPADIQALLPYDMRDDQQHLSRMQGINLNDHLQRLEQVRAKLLSAYGDMTLEEFRRARRLPEYDVSPEWVLHHLMQHEGEHRGQITELRLSAESALQRAQGAK